MIKLIIPGKRTPRKRKTRIEPNQPLHETIIQTNTVRVVPNYTEQNDTDSNDHESIDATETEDDAKKKRNVNNISRNKLDELLKNVEGQDRDENQWWNNRLFFAAKCGKISETILKASLSCKVSCVKTSLKSIGCPKEIQDRLRLYSIVASKLCHRLGTLLNMCVVCNKHNINALKDIAILCQDVQKLKDTILQGEKDNRIKVVLDTVVRHPKILELGPSEKELKLKCDWDQAKTYIANTFIGNVQVHVKEHLEARVRRKIRTSLMSTSYDAAIAYIFLGGDRPENETDILFCDSMIAKLRSMSLLSNNGFVIPKKQKVSLDVLMFHFELAFEEGSVFQPFPLANTVSRVHARVDSRIYSMLTKDIPRAPTFDTFVRQRIKRTINSSKWIKKTFKRVRRSSSAKKHGSRKVRRKKRYKIQILSKWQTVASFQTDGYSISLTINTPHVNQSEKLTPAKYQESETLRLRELFSTTEDGCWVAGNDPGRRNIATQAILLSNRDPLKDKASRVQFTRSQWQRLTRARQQREWESSRRVGDVKIALNALSDSGGKRGCSEERWEQYISKSIKYQSILHREFLENDERRRRAFDAYGCRHRAVDNTASRLVTSPDGKPLIIGYGDGNFPSHGRGTDTSVPTKTLFRAVKKAFKAKNIEGGVIKVWEHNTTAKCHRCHARLDKIYKTVEGRIVENLDFRRCSHCGPEKLPKMRNRDWNAALNIRVVMMAILNGEDRPVYLKPDKRPRRILRRG